MDPQMKDKIYRLILEVLENPGNIMAKMEAADGAAEKIVEMISKQQALHEPKDCPYTKYGECPICHTRNYIEDGYPRRSFVDPAQFGEHEYEERGTSDCKFGCGCWAGPSKSGGPVDPFGPCPKNPLIGKPRG